MLSNNMIEENTTLMNMMCRKIECTMKEKTKMTDAIYRKMERMF